MHFFKLFFGKSSVFHLGWIYLLLLFEIARFSIFLYDKVYKLIQESVTNSDKIKKSRLSSGFIDINLEIMLFQQ